MKQHWLFQIEIWKLSISHLASTPFLTILQLKFDDTLSNYTSMLKIQATCGFFEVTPSSNLYDINFIMLQTGLIVFLGVRLSNKQRQQTTMMWSATASTLVYKYEKLTTSSWYEETKTDSFKRFQSTLHLLYLM